MYNVLCLTPLYCLLLSVFLFSAVVPTPFGASLVTGDGWQAAVASQIRTDLFSFQGAGPSTSSGGGIGLDSSALGDFPQIMQRNTFVDIENTQPAIIRARNLRRNQTDGDAIPASGGAELTTRAVPLLQRVMTENAWICNVCQGDRNRCGCPRPRPSGGLAAEQSVEPSSFDTPSTDGSAPPSQLRRINLEGASVPGSQDTELASQAVHNLRISEVNSATPPSADRRRSHHQMNGGPPVLPRCALCGPGPGAYQVADSRGLLQHLCRSHMGQMLTAEAVAQLRSLDKVACRICGRFRARTTPTCSTCGVATSTRALRIGDIIPDTRRGQSSTAAPTAAPAQVPSGDDVGAEHELMSESPVRRVFVSQRTCDLVTGLSRHTLAHIPAAVCSKYAVAWAECNEGSVSGDTSWSVLAECRAKLILGPIPEAVDRNEEVKRRMRLLEEDRFEELAQRVQGQQTPTSSSTSRLGRAGDMDSEEAKGKRARATNSFEPR